MSGLKVYWLETKYEVLKLLRLPAFAIPTITFPVFFYVLFGLSMGGRGMGAVRLPTYLIATYGAFGMMGAALFGFGVGIAIERGQGWLLLKRATPMPPTAYFVAKIATAMLFGGAGFTAMSVLGVLFGSVQLLASQWALLGSVMLFGALPFCAFGLLLGLVLGPNSAAPIVGDVDPGPVPAGVLQVDRPGAAVLPLRTARALRARRRPGRAGFDPRGVPRRLRARLPRARARRVPARGRPDLRVAP
jgi:hypothetical protein